MWGQIKNSLGRTFSKGTFPSGSAFLLESPLRQLIKSPRKVADRLDLHPGHHVIELGAGSGYYSLEVASRLTTGTLMMIDVQPGMLSRAAKAVTKSGLSNTGLVVADGACLPVPSNQFDRVFMVTVFGEIINAKQALQESYRVLRHGGLLSIGEQRSDPDFVSIHTLTTQAEEAGFVLASQFGPTWNYTANFRKP